MDCLFDNELRLEQIRPLIDEFLAQGKPVTFAPRGVSMLPMIRQGIDRVVLESCVGKLKKYDIPLYQRDDGSYVLHRVVGVGDTYTCIGDNQFQLEHGVRHDQIIANVTGFYREDTYYSVSNPAYRLYCRMWCWSRSIRGFWRRVRSRLRRWIR